MSSLITDLFAMLKINIHNNLWSYVENQAHSHTFTFRHPHRHSSTVITHTFIIIHVPFRKKNCLYIRFTHALWFKIPLPVVFFNLLWLCPLFYSFFQKTKVCVCVCVCVCVRVCVWVCMCVWVSDERRLRTVCWSVCRSVSVFFILNTNTSVIFQT
jgi:hypothetical protein